MMVKWPSIFLFLMRTAKWAWVVVVLAICYWIYDRDLPTRIIARPTAPTVYAGQEAKFDMPVVRDLERKCSMRISRYMIDSNGTRHEVTFNQEVNFDGIKSRQEATPDRLSLAFPVDQRFPSGFATLNTETQYTCLTNPLTQIWPIRTSYEWPFYVLPPQPASGVER